MAIESEEEEDIPLIIDIESDVNSETNVITEKAPKVEETKSSGKLQSPEEVVVPAALPIGGHVRSENNCQRDKSTRRE